jgi:NAD(P)-dependent dehydrogenase (short-subunit alcohol dehydrogenase family)
VNAPADMTGKVCIVTGAGGGIGKATAIALAEAGATLVLVARPGERSEAALAEVRLRSGSDAVDLIGTDLASAAAIRRLAEEVERRYERADVLVNNAHTHHHKRVLSPDGVDEVFAVTYLSYFLLTNLLLETLQESAPARVVNVADDPRIVRRVRLDFDDLLAEREQRYSGLRVHNRAKRCVFLYTFELARRLRGTGVTVNSLYPGHTDTGLKGEFPAIARVAYPLGKALGLLHRPEDGADTAVYLASAPELEGVTGKHFVHRTAVDPPAELDDPEAARRLWEISDQMTGIGERRPVETVKE